MAWPSASDLHLQPRGNKVIVFQFGQASCPAHAPSLTSLPPHPAGITPPARQPAHPLRAPRKLVKGNLRSTCPCAHGAEPRRAVASRGEGSPSCRQAAPGSAYRSTASAGFHNSSTIIRLPHLSHSHDTNFIAHNSILQFRPLLTHGTSAGGAERRS